MPHTPPLLTAMHVIIGSCHSAAFVLYPETMRCLLLFLARKTQQTSCPVHCSADTGQLEQNLRSSGGFHSPSKLERAYPIGGKPTSPTLLLGHPRASSHIYQSNYYPECPDLRPSTSLPTPNLRPPPVRTLHYRVFDLRSPRLISKLNTPVRSPRPCRRSRATTNGALRI